MTRSFRSLFQGFVPLVRLLHQFLGDTMNSIHSALTTLGLAATLLGIGMPTLVQAHSTSTITAPMGSVDAYNEGVYQAQQGNYSQAIAHWGQALAFNPQFSEAHYNRGLAYLLLGDAPAAISEFDRALELNPEDADAYKNRGLAHQALGNEPEAIADFTQSLQLNPKDAEAYQNRSLVRMSLGDKAGAVQDARQASTLFLAQGDPHAALTSVASDPL